MKQTTRWMAAVAMVAGLAGSAFAASEGWTTDFEAAKKTAEAEEKDLLINFTGSDWCGWCIKLKEEVFDHDAFKEGVKDDFVLVELDFPQNEELLSEETREQNKALAEMYGVEGFPTIVLADGTGKPYAQTGYQEGGPEKYLEHLEALGTAKTTRDEGLKAAAELEGVAKAEKLIEVLKELGLSDGMINSFYGDVVEQIKAADPEDKTGFSARAAAAGKLADFEAKLQGFGETGDMDGAMKLVDETLEAGGLSPEVSQRIAITRALIFAQQEKFEEAVKAASEAKALAPDSEVAPRIDDFIGQLTEAAAAAATEEAPAAPTED